MKVRMKLYLSSVSLPEHFDVTKFTGDVEKARALLNAALLWLGELEKREKPVAGSEKEEEST